MYPNYRDKLHTLPPHMHGAIVRWIERGIRPGDFLTALLSNDLMEAFGRADDQNTAAMQNWVIYLHNYAPIGCFGSPAKFQAWHEQGGLCIEEQAA